MSTSPDQQEPGAAKAQAKPRTTPASGDDVLGVLNEFEQGLESLKKLYAERKAIIAALESRESELAQRELDIARREQDAQARREEAEQLQQQVTELAKTLQDRENGLREQRELLDHAQNEAKRRTEELEALDRAIAERAAAQSVEAQRTAAGLDSKLTELRKAGEDLAAQRQKAEADRAKLAALVEELPKREALVAERQTAIENERRNLDAARAALASAEDALRAEQVAAKESESQEVARLTGLLERAETTAGEMGKRAEQAATQAETAAKRALSLEEQIKALQTQAQQSAATGNELSETKTKLERLEKQFNEAQAERDAANARAQQAEAKAQQFEAKAKELAASLAAATSAAAQSGTQRDQSEHALRQQIDQTRSDLSELEKVLDQLRDRLQREAARADDATKRVTELEAIMTSPAGAESALRIECDRLQEEVAQARQQLANRPTPVVQRAPGAPANTADVEWVAARRKRLSRGKSLLVEQTRKIRRAGEVLHKRFEQCEQILAQRVELSLAKRAIDNATKKAAQREAKAKAGSLVFFSVFTISILGGLSWFAAGQFFPGQYASRATIAADGKGRELTADELKEWQTFHNSLVEDPRFVEVAADRMNQRGITSLGQAGAVGQLVKSSVSTSSTADGQLTIELRGDGPARTQRILDTFTIALASQANAARERRIDGGSTVIKESASLPTAPLDNERVVYAAILWAGSSLFALIVGLVIWKQLAAAKARFEQSNQVDAVLDESRWPTLQG